MQRSCLPMKDRQVDHFLFCMCNVHGLEAEKRRAFPHINRTYCFALCTTMFIVRPRMCMYTKVVLTPRLYRCRHRVSIFTSSDLRSSCQKLQLIDDSDESLSTMRSWGSVIVKQARLSGSLADSSLEIDIRRCGYRRDTCEIPSVPAQEKCKA